MKKIKLFKSSIHIRKTFIELDILDLKELQLIKGGDGDLQDNPIPPPPPPAG